MTLSSVSLNTNYQIINGTQDVLAVDTAGGPVTLTAKSGIGAPAAGQSHFVRDTGSGSSTNKIIFAPGGGGTIDGAASKDLVTTAGACRIIRCASIGVWQTIGGEF